MGSLRSLRSEAREIRLNSVFPPERVSVTFYDFVESWSKTYRDDFVEVIGELYQGHRGTSYYCFRDSLLNHYHIHFSEEAFYTEILAIVTDLWEDQK